MTIELLTKLSLFNRVTAKKAAKMVRIECTPGNSQAQLNAIQRDIAVFAKKKGLNKVVAFDMRKYANDEFISPMVENDMASRVEVAIKKGKQIAKSSIDYFTSPEEQFVPRFYAELEKLSNVLGKKKGSAKVAKEDIQKLVTIEQNLPIKIDNPEKLQKRLAQIAQKNGISEIKVERDKNSKHFIIIKATKSDELGCTGTLYLNRSSLGLKEIGNSIKEWASQKGGHIPSEIFAK